jgi:flavin-dependent dehydrogenase
MPATFFLSPRPFEDEYMLGVNSQAEFDYIRERSAFSRWFSGAKVKRTLGYVFGLRSPVSEPYRENVLLVGDATWFAEAEITGSMMCGWKAANAVATALRDGRPDRSGVINYIEWWKKSFPEFDDYRNFMSAMLFNLILSDEERTYLYRLFEKPLRATLNPFLVVRLFKESLKPLMAQIERNMPSAVEKLMMLEADTAETILMDIAKSMMEESS